jgi:uncharacterized protein
MKLTLIIPNDKTTGMTGYKKIVELYMEGFRQGDHEVILSCLTDDVTWDIPGHVYLQGKEKFEKEIENDAFVGLPDITIIRLVEENDIVVAEGTVQSKMKDGGRLDAVFCDVFHFREGKIKQLTSYLAQKKSQ